MAKQRRQPTAKRRQSLMLQRIQTLFLAIVAIAMGVFIALPLWEKVAADGIEQASMTALYLTHTLNATQSEVQPVFYLAGMAVLVAGIAVFAIFKFRNRLLQSALCAVNSILMTVMLATIVYQTFYKAAKLFDPGQTGNYLTGFYALIVAMLANVLANRFIRRDERMVKESNRMR
jgi:glucan phosphoethanolaminetransferase (alkaline phosphatase superfamily)